MNKIMELAYHYGAACERRALVGRVSARLDLATEVQAHIDYTRAVIAERDALRKTAQMALDAYDHHYADDPESKVAFEALRKELGL